MRERPVLGYPTDLSLSLEAEIRVWSTKSTAVVDMRECPVLSYQDWWDLDTKDTLFGNPRTVKSTTGIDIRKKVWYWWGLPVEEDEEEEEVVQRKGSLSGSLRLCKGSREVS